MTTRMLIDARHPEETRVAVANGTRIEEFDFESAQRAQIKGNIYLAKVTRVEPSLQAAFIEYGGNRHGFLAFSEIHPDYYQIPKSDRDALLAEEQAAAREHADDLEEEPPHEGEDGEEDAHHSEAGQDDDHHESASNDALRKKRQNLRKKYKIQEVIKRRQVLLVQVVKEERGNKGAAMTTYLSLAGRYSVLMPNTSHGGGISRKIASAADRKRLKSIVNELDLPANMGVIVRTAGASRTKTEVKRDFDYLSRLWDGIRKTTLASSAPALIHEDSDLIKRAIRDLYTREIDEVLVDGEAGYTDAKGFMKLLMPSHAKKVQHYRDAVPLFQRYRIEEQLAEMYQPVVQLKSGGYLVINPTEALVSIDINSGKSTREHSIEETAYKTNVEAAREIARQLKLRDMSGLIVIDFIDMDHSGNVRKVEKALKEALKDDRARIQVGRISQFGLMEMSRQRLRTGVLEASTHTCPTCDGAGMVRTTESAGLGALRLVEATALKGKNNDYTLHLPTETAIYLLNDRRAQLNNLELRYGIKVTVCPESEMHLGDIDLEARGGPPVPTVDITKPELDEPDEPEDEEIEDEEDEEDDDNRGRGGRGRGRGGRERGGRSRGGRNRRGRGGRDGQNDDEETESSRSDDRSGGDDEDEGERRPRSRRSRGGRGRKRSDTSSTETQGDEGENAEASSGDDDSGGERKPRRRSRGGRGGRGRGRNDAANEDAETDNDTPSGAPADRDDDDAPMGRRRGRRGGRGRRSDSGGVSPEDNMASEESGDVAAEEEDAPASNPPAAETSSDEPERKPRRRRRTKAEIEADKDAEEGKPDDAPEKPKRARKAPAKSAAKAPPKAKAKPEPKADSKAEAAPEKKSTAAPKVVAEDSGAQATENTGPKRKGWWQRTFG